MALAAQHPGQAFAVQAALEDEASVHRAVAAAVEHLGPVNVLVVNHGIWPPEDVLVKVASGEMTPFRAARQATPTHLVLLAPDGPATVTP